MVLEETKRKTVLAHPLWSPEGGGASRGGRSGRGGGIPEGSLKNPKENFGNPQDF